MKKILRCSLLLGFVFGSLRGLSQNIGIGTANPQQKLHVAGGLRLDTLANGIDSGLVRFEKNGSLYGLRFNGDSTTLLRGNATFGSGNAWNLKGNTGIDTSKNFIGTLDLNALKFKVNRKDAALIDVTGNLGVGTNSPQAKLHVNGSVRLDTLITANKDSGLVRFNSNGVLNGLLFNNDSTSVLRGNNSFGSIRNIAWGLSGNTGIDTSKNFIGTVDNHPLKFKVNNTNAAIIASDGNTSLGYGAGVSASGFTNATAIGNGAIVDASNKVRVGNTQVTSIGGQVGWTKLSDGRYKTDVREDVKGLDLIKKLRPVTYYVDEQKLAGRWGEVAFTGRQKQQRRETGFIAQEVESLTKQLGFEFSGVDVPENPNALYGLRYADFVVPIVKAVQEQQAIIEHLQDEVNDLKKKLTELFNATQKTKN
jgi:hypothetical protein